LIGLRPFTQGQDDSALWSMLEPAFRAGDTYTVDPGISRADALAFWCAPEKRVFMAETDRIVGTYYLKPNQGGGGAHVCNAGFVTHPDARGQGVAQAMLDHALATARAAGFRAMQFNFVVATNEGAIRLWARNGFDTVGRLPGAFRHPQYGYVDALVMYRRLNPSPA
jgi:ribosomal protein S18 acetylase RimI-like enzyme